MNIISAIMPFVVLACVAGAHAGWTDHYQPFTASDGMPYRLLVPDGYEPSASYPLVLFLHGKEGEGTQNQRHLYNGSAGKISWMGKGVFVLAPQATSAGGFTDQKQVRRAHQVLAEVRGRYSIDQSRVYVTGLSRGGNGTMRMVALYPETFAGAVAICGWGDRLWEPGQTPSGQSQWAAKMANTPIWFFHGLDDEVIAASNSQYMHDQIKQSIEEAGCKADTETLKITLYEGVQHDSWSDAYGDPRLNQWLFSQRRGKKCCP